MILEFVLFLSLVLILRHWLTRPKGLPPGPRGFPIIGSGVAYYLKQVLEYRKKYGDIFMLNLFGMRFLYICDYKLIKETLGRQEISNRPSLKGFHFMTDGKEAGVIMSNGQRWVNARRFLLRNLRDLGMGKSRLDEAIIHEARSLVEDLKRYTGKPTRFPESLNFAVLNVIWQMIASRRYDLYDKEVTDFMKIVGTLQDDFLGFMIVETFPILKRILPKFIFDKLLRLEVLEQTVVSAKKLFGKTIETRKAQMDVNHSENVIDEYLIQMNNKTEIAEFFSEGDLMKISLDMFGAGFDSTSNMLMWIILYAAKYPDVQKRVQEQIDEVVPRGEFPTNQHKSQLSLLEAFIHEVLRMSSLVPFGVMHTPSEDTHIAGYLVPKGTFIFCMFGYMHQDPRYWESPEEFRIERFLDEDGKFISHKEGLAPFSLGKRSCLGESLARMEMSIFSAALFQNFTFSPPEGKEIDLGPENLAMIHPAPKQDLLISARN
ncbi:cytochrome P450 2L1-like [Macrobrachium rosenbergii]|uniref:cytochrome P450 2L1-like n=1 Tax=Macrobrachium rosenbergii TaxID=79674 RepID=UPI0034D63C9F